MKSVFTNRESLSNFTNRVCKEVPDLSMGDWFLGKNTFFGNFSYVYFRCRDFIAGNTSLYFLLGENGDIKVIPTSEEAHRISVADHVETPQEFIDKIKEMIPVYMAYIRLTMK